MEKIGKFRKRPCSICRKWFHAHPRLGDRQMTCGSENCMRKWHNKRCSEWNKKNQFCSRTNYLSKKLAAIAQSVNSPVNQSPPASLFSVPKNIKVEVAKPRMNLGLPRKLIQEVISPQQLVIIEYMMQVLFNRFQEVIKAQPTEIKRDYERLPPESISRFDSQKRGP